MEETEQTHTFGDLQAFRDLLFSSLTGPLCRQTYPGDTSAAGFKRR